MLGLDVLQEAPHVRREGVGMPPEHIVLLPVFYGRRIRRNLLDVKLLFPIMLLRLKIVVPCHHYPGESGRPVTTQWWGKEDTESLLGHKCR